MRAKQTTYVDVEVTDSDVFKEAMTRMLRAHGLGPEQYIRDGMIIEDDDSGPGRPWERVIRKATPLQIKVYDTLQAFRQCIKEIE